MAVKQKATPRRSAATNNGTLFVCEIAPEAKSVCLVGEFNNWDPNTHPMVKKGGRFQKRLKLAPGEYQYKFIIDGEWRNDPKADQVPNEFGTTNNIIRV